MARTGSLPKCLAGSGSPIAAQIFLDSSSLAPSFFLLTPAHPGTVVGDFRAYPVSSLGETYRWILAWLGGVGNPGNHNSFPLFLLYF